MRTDAEIQKIGFEALSSQLGPIEIERFLVMIKRAKFDYTQWRQGKFDDSPLDQLANAAEMFSRTTFPKEE